MNITKIQKEIIAAKNYLINTECPIDLNNANKCNMDCIDCWDDFIKNRYKNFKKEDGVV